MPSNTRPQTRPSHTRRRLWVEPAFQFRLLVRMACYIVVYTFILLHVEFMFVAMAHMTVDGPAQNHGELYLNFLAQKQPMLVAGLLFVPIMLYDMLKFSHRIAGPLFRCRNVIMEMVRGQPVAEFSPRKRDLLRELFQAFNFLIREWNTRVSNASGAAATDNARLGDGSTALLRGDEAGAAP